ncbi:hypothetical protein [Marininema halotolerans]|uniref:Uncharacterized protein n=1 Tax=Marininema halotolerans TaxID=1155944 RepID=A0A1I6NTK4_9BACL|nr:hypothetical protein [Marininema halotolerans]SFS31282.1 hypothetical protein SAMN05444972_101119 [Marininema halotolerans]
MTCASPNLLSNGGFRRGFTSWRGKGIHLAKNPLRPNDKSVRISPRGRLIQTVNGKFNRTCAYYLYFRLLNANPPTAKPALFAVVSWLNSKKRVLRTTPLLVLPPRPAKLRFTSYFTIVPPPPVGTTAMSVLFLNGSAPLFIDFISVLAKNVGSPRAVQVTKPLLLSFPF